MATHNVSSIHTHGLLWLNIQLNVSAVRRNIYSSFGYVSPNTFSSQWWVIWKSRNLVDNSPWIVRDINQYLYFKS